MTSTEAICTAIVGGFTVLGAAVRWSASIMKGVAERVVKAIDDSTAAWKETGAVVGQLMQMMVGIEAKLELKKAVEQAVEAAVDEVSAAHEPAQPPPVPRRTPMPPLAGPGLHGIRRGKTEG